VRSCPLSPGTPASSLSGGPGVCPSDLRAARRRPEISACRIPQECSGRTLQAPIVSDQKGGGQGKVRAAAQDEGPGRPQCSLAGCRRASGFMAWVGYLTSCSGHRPVMANRPVFPSIVDRAEARPLLPRRTFADGSSLDLPCSLFPCGATGAAGPILPLRETTGGPCVQTLERLALNWNRAAVPIERKRPVSGISTFGIVPSTDSSRGHDALDRTHVGQHSHIPTLFLLNRQVGRTQLSISYRDSPRPVPATSP